MTSTSITRLALGGALLATLLAPAAASAQWSRTYEQFYLPGKFNFTFRREYPAADRLFNAFDYGHAILYERLLNEPGADPATLEVEEYDFITRKLLVSPPRLPLEEAAIEINYARLAPEAKMMFDWAHLLHRQIYDVLASEEMSQAQKDAKIAALVAYYKTRGDLAFSSRPKNMELMEGQPYSLAFRQRYPKFNGLIWGYHWLQVGLYEPLMVGRTQEERQSGVLAAVTRFKQMLERAPERMPRLMPMTGAIAPRFAERYEEAAIIFDNLHAMHDVVSDILANASVPRGAKRAAILEAAARYRDDTTFLMPMDEWRTMGTMMGVVNMGGPATGVTTEWGTPTIARGATMEEAMKGMSHGAHGADTTAGGRAAADAHAGHGMPAATPAPVPDSAGAGIYPRQMRELHDRMMRDPVIHERMMADTAIRRLMQGMHPAGSGMGSHTMPGMAHGAAGHDTPAPAVRRATASPAARRPATKRATTARKPAAQRAPARAAPPAPKRAVTPAPKAMPMDHSKHTMPPARE
jgi:hypothetical protein